MERRKGEGGCACGRVRYRLSGEPLVSNVCHCRSCRSVAGAPVVAWVTVAVTDFALLAGTPATFSSSSPVTRSFCSACGTPLTYRNASRPDEIDVTTCTLDDPEACPPSHHSWVRDGISWVRLSDDLPAFREEGD